MSSGPCEALSHVLWIGGGTDSGKTSIAQVLAREYSLPVYHYDRSDFRHHQRLAKNSPAYAAFLDATMDERWIHPSIEDLVRRAWQTFSDRFPFVMEELNAISFPQGMRIIAEGFGLTPRLVVPFLRSPRQAIWLVATDEFKQASMQRRGKGEFGGQVSDPERARRNLLQRDRRLTERMRAEAMSLGVSVVEVDGSQDIAELALTLAVHFGLRDAGN